MCNIISWGIVVQSIWVVSRRSLQSSWCLTDRGNFQMYCRVQVARVHPSPRPTTSKKPSPFNKLSLLYFVTGNIHVEKIIASTEPHHIVALICGSGEARWHGKKTFLVEFADRVGRIDLDTAKTGGRADVDEAAK